MTKKKRLSYKLSFENLSLKKKLFSRFLSLKNNVSITLIQFHFKYDYFVCLKEIICGAYCGVFLYVFNFADSQFLWAYENCLSSLNHSVIFFLKYIHSCIYWWCYYWPWHNINNKYRSLSCTNRLVHKLYMISFLYFHKLKADASYRVLRAACFLIFSHSVLRASTEYTNEAAVGWVWHICLSKRRVMSWSTMMTDWSCDTRHLAAPWRQGLIKTLSTFSPWGWREPIMLLVNDFTRRGSVGDCQPANNIYGLTPRRQAADFPDPPASCGVTSS